MFLSFYGQRVSSGIPVDFFLLFFQDIVNCRNVHGLCLWSGFNQFHSFSFSFKVTCFSHRQLSDLRVHVDLFFFNITKAVFTTNQELLKPRVDIQTLNLKSSRAHIFKVFDHLGCKVHLDVYNRKWKNYHLIFIFWSETWMASVHSKSK